MVNGGALTFGDELGSGGVGGLGSPAGAVRQGNGVAGGGTLQGAGGGGGRGGGGGAGTLESSVIDLTPYINTSAFMVRGMRWCNVFSA